MNSLREKIFEEVYAGRNGDVYEDCYDATDRIIALIREALLSPEVVEAAAKALYDFDREGTDRPGWGSLQSGHHTDGVKGRRYYRHEANAALYAALDVLLGKETENVE